MKTIIQLDYQFTYHWKHIPSGKTGQRTRLFISYEHFLESLNTWNRVGSSEWLYWR